MWDNPRALNAVADALFLAALALVVWFGAQLALRSPSLPIRTVSIVGDVKHIDAASVRERLDGRVSGNFFGVNLKDVRRRVETVPWVRKASVRRQWPDRLVIEIEEHRALARWSERWLVNTHGDVFEGETDAALPRFAGPPGTEREVTRRYRAFHEALAPLGIAPTEVHLSARFAWQVKLANGIVLELGRDDGREPLETRLARFIAAFPRVTAQLNRRLEHIDLRYPNGFAIRVPELPADRDETTARKRT
jgi:cell division protein FtsQ